MTLDAHVTGIWCGQIRGGVGNIRYSHCGISSWARLILEGLGLVFGPVRGRELQKPTLCSHTL